MAARRSDHGCPKGLRPLALERAQAVAETFGVLGDPTRVRIVHALSQAELCTSDLATTVGLSESAVSHQLRTLRQLRVVADRRAGRLVYHSLSDEHVRRLFQQGLEHSVEVEGDGR